MKRGCIFSPLQVLALVVLILFLVWVGAQASERLEAHGVPIPSPGIEQVR